MRGEIGRVIGSGPERATGGVQTTTEASEDWILDPRRVPCYGFIEL